MENLFNPIEFGFKEFGKTQFGQTYRNDFVDIRRIDGWVRQKKGSLKLCRIDNDISNCDTWKIRFIGENNYIYTGIISNKNFALELFSNLNILPENTLFQLKRDFILQNLLQ